MTDIKAEADRLVADGVRSMTIERKESAAGAVLTISHVYPTGLDDLWDAIVDQQRLARWFGNVAGDFRVGGTYEVEGNATGTILTCNAPNGFSATWDFGGGTSDIRVRLAPEGDGTRLTLEHAADVPYEFYDVFGPGATGVGWDQGLLGLAAYLALDTSAPVETTEWAASVDGLAFIRATAAAWGDAAIAAGETEESARASAARTADFFSGASEPQV
ncbi:MAG TPA: SRPBCC family protein [Microbacterium sp.]|uniref:SRPBCC family protein n=1 Tax=Microbacterium sp. TaxID=51671 RepID=UPI002D146EE0|nr:SRPBCC family protein [Microbacterium sp.]HWI31045.1 SRPBCC family protein [Microbacterium sp.]